jgi:hypothetical protein
MVDHSTHNPNIVGLNPGPNIIKLFRVTILDFFKQARVFVLAKSFKPTLMFATKARKVLHSIYGHNFKQVRVFDSGEPFKPSLMFAGKTRKVLHSWVGSLAYLQTLD